jgi:hypothetical protein
MPPRAALIFAVVLACLALLFTVAMIPTVVRGWRASHVYQRSACRVVSQNVTSSVNRRGGQEFYAHVSLSLAMKGGSHAKSETFGPYQTDAKAREALAGRYAVGATVSCLYDPDNPDAIMLSADEEGPGAAVVAPLFFDAIAGLAVVFTAIRYKRWREGRGT